MKAVRLVRPIVTVVAVALAVPTAAQQPPANLILDTEVVMTIVNGEVVYDRANERPRSTTDAEAPAEMEGR